MKHRRYLIINTILIFVLYSVSLSYSFLLYGLEFPYVGGIGVIWVFPCFYLLLYISSLRLVYVKVNIKTYIKHGIIPLAFIISTWLFSLLVRVANNQKYSITIQNNIYPMILFVLSFVIFVVYIKAYTCAKEYLSKAQ